MSTWNGYINNDYFSKELEEYFNKLFDEHVDESELYNPWTNINPMPVGSKMVYHKDTDHYTLVSSVSNVRWTDINTNDKKEIENLRIENKGLEDEIETLTSKLLHIRNEMYKEGLGKLYEDINLSMNKSATVTTSTSFTLSSSSYSLGVDKCVSLPWGSSGTTVYYQNSGWIPYGGNTIKDEQQNITIKDATAIRESKYDAVMEGVIK